MPRQLSALAALAGAGCALLPGLHGPLPVLQAGDGDAQGPLAAAAAAGRAHDGSPRRLAAADPAPGRLALPPLLASLLLRAQAEAPAAEAAPPTPQQRATFCALAGPLMYLMHGQQPEPGALQAALQQAAQQPQALQPWELTSLLWSCAYLGATPGQQAPLRQLAAHAGARLASLPLYDAIACSWALLTMALAPQGLFQQLAELYRCADEDQLDEAAVVYMLQCCLWQLEAEAPAAAEAPGSQLAPGSELAPSKQLLEELLQRHKLGRAHR
jgi:hypothetical protein